MFLPTDRNQLHLTDHGLAFSGLRVDCVIPAVVSPTRHLSPVPKENSHTASPPTYTDFVRNSFGISNERTVSPPPSQHRKTPQLQTVHSANQGETVDPELLQEEINDLFFKGVIV